MRRLPEYYPYLNLDKTILPLVYKAMFHPILEYAFTVWGPLFIGDQWKVERVQKWATSMIAAIRHLHMKIDLRGWSYPPSSTEGTGDMLTVYNLFNGNVRMDWTNLFSLAPKDAPTRSHSKKLKKPVANKAHRQRFFSHHVVDLWNSLPEDVINSKTTNDFKKTLESQNVQLKQEERYTRNNDESIGKTIGSYSWFYSSWIPSILVYQYK